MFIEKIKCFFYRLPNGFVKGKWALTFFVLTTFIVNVFARPNESIVSATLKQKPSVVTSIAPTKKKQKEISVTTSVKLVAAVHDDKIDALKALLSKEINVDTMQQQILVEQH